MDETKNEKPPPDSTDLASWKQAIADGRLGQIRLEAFVTAIQDLGPSTDKAVLNALARHLNDAMLGKLRSLVSASYPNKGQEIIEQVHHKLWEELVKPESADGKGLRKAFIPRLRFRLKDVLAKESRRRRLAEDFARKSPAIDLGDQKKSAQVPNATGLYAMPDPSSLDSTVMIDMRLDVEAALETVTDDRKRLAFRLRMDGSPLEPAQPKSIPEALGISEKTARAWVKEVTEYIKLKLGDKL